MQRQRLLSAVHRACRSLTSHTLPRSFNTARTASVFALRSQASALSGRQRSFDAARAFCSPSAADEKEVPLEQAILTEIDICLGRTEKHEYDPKDKPPGEWKSIDVSGLLNGEAESNGMVCFERTYNDERITLVSSSEVLIEETEFDEDEEEDVPEVRENGFEPEGRGLTGLLLIAIARPSRKLPLFFECTFDRFGFEITRVHVGLGMAGFMMDEDGQSAMLYHLYLSHKDRAEGKTGRTMPGEEQDEPLSASSPPFHTLDVDLQRRFEQYLKERRIDDRLMGHMMDEVLARMHHRYCNFLGGLREWVEPGVLPKK